MQHHSPGKRSRRGPRAARGKEAKYMLRRHAIYAVKKAAPQTTAGRNRRELSRVFAKPLGLNNSRPMVRLETPRCRVLRRDRQPVRPSRRRRPQAPCLQTAERAR